MKKESNLVVLFNWLDCTCVVKLKVLITKMTTEDMSRSVKIIVKNANETLV